MSLEFEFEEKEQYTLEEVQGLVSDLKGQATETIELKDTELTEALEQAERVSELEGNNHTLQIKNLAIQNGIDEELIDLIADDDIEVVKTKIDKLKSMQKEKEIDNSYKPTKTREDDAYQKAIDNKDSKSALKSKFARIFE